MPRALAVELALTTSPSSWTPRQLAHENRLLMTELLKGLSFVVREQADLHVLSGMLSLERRPAAERGGIVRDGPHAEPSGFRRGSRERRSTVGQGVSANHSRHTPIESSPFAAEHGASLVILASGRYERIALASESAGGE